MCNLYSVTEGQQAIRDLFRVVRDTTGNLPPMPGIFPDYMAPIVRNTPEGRELTMMRWGMPSYQKALVEATQRRAQKLQAKGRAVDFKELLRMEPESGRSKTGAWRRSGALPTIGRLSAFEATGRRAGPGGGAS